MEKKFNIPRIKVKGTIKKTIILANQNLLLLKIYKLNFLASMNLNCKKVKIYLRFIKTMDNRTHKA